MSKSIVPGGFSGIVKLKSVLEHPEPLYDLGQQYILNGKPYLRLSIQDGGGLIDLTHQSIIEVVGTFTSSLPSSPVKGIYLFAGLDGASVGGVTYHNGDSAFWDGSAWTKISGGSTKASIAIIIEQLRLHNPQLNFKGFAFPSTVLTTSANNAYLIIEDGDYYVIS